MNYNRFVLVRELTKKYSLLLTSMIQRDEGHVLSEQLHELLRGHDITVDDDLESVLTWINPNEPTSNHQLRPPSLRLKSAIKILINENGNGPALTDILRQYLIFQTRKHFFAHYYSLCHFKDVQKLA